ncbi:MAG TPA: hypothetical protein VD694_06740 [Nitrososphaeraceae archaeon]|nr:hypothetical protein [Nitrososphaeraceae archaeon]
MLSKGARDGHILKFNMLLENWNVAVQDQEIISNEIKDIHNAITHKDRGYYDPRQGQWVSELVPTH